MPTVSFQDLLNLVKTGATLPAQEKILELRQQMMDLQKENLSLRTQVQELQSQVRSLSQPSLPRCPRCGQPAWSLKESRPDPLMEAVGVFRRRYECGTCGFTEDRQEPG